MKSIINEIEKKITDRRRKHTYGVCEHAVALARKYGADEEKARQAALFHDLYKDISKEELAELVDLYGLDERYKDSLNLAHSKLAAAAMERDYGIDDRELLNAVSYHTTGRADMTMLEKIIYIADATEPGRSYPGVEALRALAETDIDAACFLAVKNTIEHLKAQNLFIDEDSVNAEKYFKKERDMKGHEEIKETAFAAAKFLDSKKAEDTVIIDIANKASFADYMVIASGNSERQIGNLADDLKDKLAESGIHAKNTEGEKTSGWLLIDFGDLIVNVLTKEMRQRYNIEKVWGDCDFINIGEEV